MKLNKVEKIVVVVILLGIILVGGFFLFVLPSYNNIDKANKTLAANRLEQSELNDRLSRLDTIDADIAEQKNSAVAYEGGFYPDLTTYETSEIAMALLKDSGLEAHTIGVSAMGTRDLSLEVYNPIEITYQLKTFSQAARDIGKEEQPVVEGSFEDNGKTYTISAASVTIVTIMDDQGNVVEPGRYTDTMKKMYKAAVCRLVAAGGQNQTVGTTSASYTIKGKYGDYIKFIDYINTLPKATWIQSVVIPMTTTIAEEEDSDAMFVGEDGTVSRGAEANGQEVLVDDNTEVEQAIQITFLCVEPMDSLKTVDVRGENIVVDQRPAVY